MFGSIVSACCRFKQWAKSIGILDIDSLWGYWRTDTGVNGKLAVGLNGTDEWLSGESSGFTNFEKTDSFSISAFVNPDIVTGVNCIVGNNDNSTGQRGIRLLVRDSKLELDLLASSFTDRLRVAGDTTLTPGTWYHFVAVFTGSSTPDDTNIKLYINGSSESFTEVTDNLTGSIDSTANWSIGRPGIVTSDYFDGPIDQVIIFNKALDEDILGEVTALYNSGTGIKHRNLTGSETFYSSIAAWYDFDSPRNFGRESSQETHAVSLGVSDYFDCGTFFDTTVQGGSWTLNFWLKFTSGGSTGTEVIFGGIDTSSSELFQFVHVDDGSADDGKLWFRIGDGTNTVSCFSNETFQDDNQWRFLTVSCSSNTVKMYINGVQLTLDTDDISSVNQSIIAISNGYHLGQRSGGFGAIPFVGVIDQTQIYNAELSASTINSLYNNGAPLNYDDLSAAQKTNLVSHWDFNEQDHTIIGQDSHTNLNHLTPNNIVEADLVGGVKDARTQYVDLGGSGDYLEVFDNAFNFGDNDFTTSLWFNSDITTAHNIMGYFHITGANRAWLLENIGSNTLRLRASNDGTATTNCDITDARITSGVWLFAVCQYRASDNNILLYVYDSAGLIGSNSADIGGALYSPTGASFAIGDVTNGAGSPDFNGKVSQCHVYSELIDATLRGELYSLGQDSTLADYTGSTANLVAWYDFENSADLGADSHTNNYDLTVNGTPTVGPARETSLDLTENGIDSSNAVGGVVTGNIANQEAVNEWLDLSGNNYDFNQSTIDNQPLAVENGIGTDPSFNHFWEDGTQNLRQAGYNWENTDITVALWLKWYSTSSGTYKFAIGQWGSAGDKVWGIRYGTTGFQMSATPDGTNVTSTAQYTITDDTWYLFVGQFNKTSQTLKHWIYDTSGTLLDENESASLGADLHTGTVSNLTYGGSDVWEGATANAAIWTKLLSTSERNAVVSAMVEEVGL